MDSADFNLSLNISDGHGGFLCPVCGCGGDLRASYDDRGGIAGTGICRCCLWEPGFDDDPHASPDAQPTVRSSLALYREKWTADGLPWRGKAELRATDWNGARQLRQLHRLAPWLFPAQRKDVP